MPFRTRVADPEVAARIAALLPGKAARGWVPESPPDPVRRAAEGWKAPVPGAAEALSDRARQSAGTGPWTGPSEEEDGEPWPPGPSWRDAVPDQQTPAGREASGPAPGGPEAAIGSDADRLPDAPGRGDEGPATSVLALLRAGRIDPGRRGVLALVGVGLVAALAAGLLLLRGRPSEQPLLPPTSTGPSSSAPAGGPADPGGRLVVDVTGRVRRPGIVRLPPGARVDDALRAAGGVLRGASTGLLNLAQKVTDGQQVLVGVAAPATGLGGAAVDGATSGGQVDLNNATPAELDGLPGVGPVLAQRIVDWRTEHGRFASVDQLREVSGIGESKYGLLKAKVRV